MAGIGTLKESSLHFAIKKWYRQDGDLLEQKYGVYTLDIQRGELIIEVQTGNFSKLRDKLAALLPDHPIKVVYPIPVIKWISRRDVFGELSVSRRRSPQKNDLFSLFNELVYLRAFLSATNLSLEVLLIEQEDTWIDDSKGSWRRKHWSIYDRQLVAVYRRVLFANFDDYRALLPAELDHFSSRELSEQLGIPPQLARKMLYCLAPMGIIRVVEVKNRRRYYSRI